MRLQRIHIKNFRSIRDATVEVAAQTAILGTNGAGKSTILRALDRFYGPSTKVDSDDYYTRNSENPIEIGLTFTDLTPDEQETFGSRVHNGELTVVREFIAGSTTSGRFYGMTLQHPPFAAIRSIPSARDRISAYSALREQGGLYATLPSARSADQVEIGLSGWEEQNRDQLSLERDDGQFLGFANVGRGSLAKATTVVFIPAVRDATVDVVDAKGSVISRLMELVVRSMVQKREDILRFQEQTIGEFRRLTSPENLTELGSLSATLTETLKVFYGNAGVSLKWQETDDLRLPLPTADVLLDDDGFEGPVQSKGHGLQRALVLTLLQHLAKASAEAVEDEADPARDADQGAARPRLPNIILAIEEPELYQHPTKQRHFAKVLTQLSQGELPGVASSTQVIFASHSSLFVSMERFDDIRLARKRHSEGQEHRECQITRSTLADLAARLERAEDQEPGTYDADGLRPRLHVINSEVAEGLFADAVVLVEGGSDRAAIIAAAKLNGVDLEARGIAVLAVEGKSKLAKPAAIFLELEIPVYLVWDCDMKPSGAIEADLLEQNHTLQRLLEVTDEGRFDAETTVTPRFACFKDKLETTLATELGDDVINAQIDAARAKYGFTKAREVLKSPGPMYDVLIGAAASGRTSPTLDRIVESIVAMVEPADKAAEGDVVATQA